MIVKVTDKTFYFDFGWICVPYYKLNDTDIVMLDSGLRKEGAEIINHIGENGLHPVAVIHSHIHDDHVNGDLCLLEKFPIKIYGSMKDVDASYEEYGYVKEVPKLKEGDVKDLFDMCKYMAQHMSDISNTDSVEIYGETFKLISTPGHSTDHKMIVTPDGVCYLGDVLMANKTLNRAKLPYSYHLKEDLESKDSVRNYRYEHYIAAHDGHFDVSGLDSVINHNFDIFNGLISSAKDIFREHPNISNLDASTMLQKSAGLRGHIDIPWVLHTIDEIFKII